MDAAADGLLPRQGLKAPPQPKPTSAGPCFLQDTLTDIKITAELEKALRDDGGPALVAPERKLDGSKSRVSSPLLAGFGGEEALTRQLGYEAACRPGPNTADPLILPSKSRISANRVAPKGARPKLLPLGRLDEGFTADWGLTGGVPATICIKLRETSRLTVVEGAAQSAGAKEKREDGNREKRGVQAAGTPGHQLGPIATAMRVSPAAGVMSYPWTNSVSHLAGRHVPHPVMCSVPAVASSPLTAFGSHCNPPLSEEIWSIIKSSGVRRTCVEIVALTQSRRLHLADGELLSQKELVDVTMLL
ncbi:hypothetical protein NA56DRAFT_739848 [Hyaloscypha hepaticicola]|uniref:Uncharacterized protein n=1 Tax=Hyaloscypha hepaticicola TaxID=2082293 RepID=A0A2J6QFN7_9HELO|nr:hypothetical protein NA56DRAFT_739848 [Hyaloscypha hepaticicola]